MAAPLVISTATALCTFGQALATLNVLPTAQVLVEGQPVATVNDAMPLVNLPPFGTCSSLSNPAVASATSAAQGVLTPQPCTPLPTPWTPGVPQVIAGGSPVVNASCRAICSYGGLITIVAPGASQTIG